MKIRHYLTVTLGGLISCLLLLTFLLALWPVTIRVDHDWLKPLALLMASALYLGGVGLLFRYLHRIKPRTGKWLSGGLWLAFLVIQLWVATTWVAAPRADLYFVHQQALNLLNGHWDWSSYFYVYPNNVTFTLLLSGIMRVGHLLTGSYSGVWLNIIQFAWLDAGLLAIWRQLRRHNPARANLFLLIIMTTVPLYAYALNTYSDTYVLPLGLLAIAAFRHLQRAQSWEQITWRSILLSCLLVAAYLLKANFIVLVIAVLVAIWLRPNQSPHQSFTRCLLTLVLLATLVVGGGLTTKWQKANGYTVDANQSLPATSWVAMSWNPHTYGQYKRADVNAIRQQPTKTAKQKLASQTLTTRLHDLGWQGILQHLFRKARLFLSSGTFDSFQINTAFDRAPNWYRQHRATSDWFLANWCQISYLALILVNLGWGVQQIRRYHLTSAYLLGGLFFMGLICFHVIFWETEERYALPVLFLLIAGTAAGYRQPLNILRYSQRSRWLPLGMALAFTTLLGFAAWQNTNLMVRSNSDPVSVVSQNEGQYFQNHQLTLKSNRSLTQPFTATLPFDQITVNNGERLTGRLALKNVSGKTVWQSHGRHLRLNQALPLQPAGRYRLTVTNRSPKDITLTTAPATYRLLPQALTTHPDQYLRFAVTQQSVAPVLSNGKFWLLFGAMWLSGLLVIDRFYWYRRRI
ncbi:hypothetical protein [Levilactobacillus sp. 244-2]|uniref:hypothetical protein n=1 Tax=Levilactobacillus sp. 244-2 TaxID=2799569 RepID=UPI00194E96D6|nr:hypothetical protein [Levilactobacillus sp. 244-2]